MIRSSNQMFEPINNISKICKNSNKKKIIPCLFCNQNFKIGDRLFEHMACKHYMDLFYYQNKPTDEPAHNLAYHPYQCKCGDSFISQSLLHKHIYFTHDYKLLN